MSRLFMVGKVEGLFRNSKKEILYGEIKKTENIIYCLTCECSLLDVEYS